ncbi:MAG TPA: type II toxin-antitoxin system VapC family toxin [Rhizomicrobium sp.]
MICLDTNAVIAFLKGTPRALVDRFAREILHASISISVITLYELHYGIAKSARRAENTDRLLVFLQLPIVTLSFEPEDAEEAGAIRAALERAGTPIGPYDLLIAAQVRRRGAVLVTANATEFSRVPRLRLENWATA